MVMASITFAESSVDHEPERDYKKTQPIEQNNQKSLEETSLLPQLSVIGGTSSIFTISGSAHYLDAESIKEHSYDEINRVLRQVPGVVCNIGFRNFPV